MSKDKVIDKGHEAVKAYLASLYQSGCEGSEMYQKAAQEFNMNQVYLRQKHPMHSIREHIRLNAKSKAV